MLELIKANDDTLHTNCEPITEITDEIFELGQQMIKLMYEKNGIGLAAPQVGISKRMFVMHVYSQKDVEKSHPAIIINPVIKPIEESGHITTYEGCLSYPGLEIPVKRAKEVMISYCNLNGEYIETHLEGINAICAQHETDHIDGITFLDRVNSKTRKMQIKKWLKAKKRQRRRS